MSDEEGEGDWEESEQDKWVVAKKSECLACRLLLGSPDWTGSSPTD
jgi:hypothetical protein